jgi:ATP-dependent DNA helicase RecG
VVLRHQTLSAFYGGSVGLLHGGMNQVEKDQVMKDFKSGHLNVLVATTVIEVGIDVPNATLIVIEDATSFGLSQLHQLRGRVGRSNLQSYCILIYQVKSLSEVGKKRLNIIKSSNDGFEISQQDLILRGAGDFIGYRQSGQGSFVFTNFISDVELLEMARSYVTKNIHMKPGEEIIKLFDQQHIAQGWVFA